jgi:endogenous inhibitor of DNA gyrase (YacG/DUF329 family)
MGTITVTCPVTSKAISTGIETEAEVFEHLPQIEAAVHCPHCGEKHFWTPSQAVLREPKSQQAA